MTSSHPRGTQHSSPSNSASGAGGNSNWRALTRDVPFWKHVYNERIATAVAELKAVFSTVESPAVLTEVLDSVAELLDTCLNVADADRAAVVYRDAIEIATAVSRPIRIDAFKRRLTEFEA